MKFSDFESYNTMWNAGSGHKAPRHIIKYRLFKQVLLL